MNNCLFCTENSIINPVQFGFTKGKSTQDAIINLTEFIYDTLNSKEHCLSIQVDYQKAFDTVAHDLLLNKLEKYGIRRNSLQLFRSFLTNRFQSVKHGSVISDSLPISIGIPQGTILGPLLFLLYINDMPNFSTDCSPTLFADDTTLCFRGPDYPALVNKTTAVLSEFHVWSQSNGLSVHPNNTN